MMTNFLNTLMLCVTLLLCTALLCVAIRPELIAAGLMYWSTL